MYVAAHVLVLMFMCARSHALMKMRIVFCMPLNPKLHLFMLDSASRGRPKSPQRRQELWRAISLVRLVPGVRLLGLWAWRGVGFAGHGQTVLLNELVAQLLQAVNVHLLLLELHRDVHHDAISQL